MSYNPHLYGIAAIYDQPEALLNAARKIHQAGFRRVRAYTPFPVEGLAEALGFDHNRLPLLVLAGGLIGGAGGYFMQYYACVINYPLNVGGRPLNSWPSFMPITFELTVLLASLTAFVSVFALSGLPCLYHPIFNAPHFEEQTRGRFVLCMEAIDPLFQSKLNEIESLLLELGAQEVVHVEE